MMPLAFARDALPQAEWRGSWPEALNGFVIDTRQVSASDVFLALPGERTDGHSFLAAARENGAAGAIVSRFQDDRLPQVCVTDVQQALTDLAAAWRRQWSGRLLALTGSNGKTTVKEMLAAIAGQLGPVCVTQGNLNNHLGVPLTLLRLAADQELAIIEMGANHAGEIAALAAIARPDVGIVTLAAAAHLEGFGSLEGVARAKGELFQALPAPGCAIINADDPFAELWAELNSAGQVLRFGRDADVSYRDWVGGAAEQSFRLCAPGWEAELTLAVGGRHNLNNALAATAGALALGIEPSAIQAGLESFRAVPGRQRHTELAGCVLIDDSYNANPGSVAAAIEVLADLPGPRLLCLGDMAELGAQAAQLHADVGTVARGHDIHALWACGPLASAAAESFGEGARSFADREQLQAALLATWGEFRTVLVKGSRSAAMDQIVSAVKAGVDHA